FLSSHGYLCIDIDWSVSVDYDNDRRLRISKIHQQRRGVFNRWSQNGACGDGIVSRGFGYEWLALDGSSWRNVHDGLIGIMDGYRPYRGCFFELSDCGTATTHIYRSG